MDDDDYYPPDRVKHAVQSLMSHKLDLCGSSKNILYFTDDKSIWEIGPYAPNHATFGTMAFSKKYALTHFCDETVNFAEEMAFTNRYSERCFQLSTEKVMVVMCHFDNTFNKHKLRSEENPAIRKTSMPLKSFIRNAKMREFYSSA